MKKPRLEKEILLSHGKCNKEGLSKTLSQPTKISEIELETELKNNSNLIKAFEESIEEIKEFITDEYLFLLTNFEATLLNKKSDLEEEILIKPGMSFLRKNSGTNAISLAKKLKDKVFLLPQQHYCDFFKKWYCFALPIRYKENIIGFLDISSIQKELKDELKGIAVLLKDRIVKKLEEFKINNEIINLTSKQREVLYHLSCGLTEREIANQMYCSKSNVKYHKKIIFKELKVDNTREAIIKGIKLGIVNLKEISL